MRPRHLSCTLRLRKEDLCVLFVNFLGKRRNDKTLTAYHIFLEIFLHFQFYLQFRVITNINLLTVSFECSS